MKKLLFTDLDGTLLDLNTYSSEHVKEYVQRLKEIDITIIFCSSKTWAEQEVYHQELEISAPVIVENGSGIFFPTNTDLKFLIPLKDIHERKALFLGRDYKEVVQAIEGCSNDMNFKYYHNQSIDQIATITGLSLGASEKAKTRDFSETIFNANRDSLDYKSFESSMQQLGFQCLSGSKYVTITGKESDKGKAVSLLIEAYKEKFGQVESYGIGDSRNDLEMLQAVQVPYLVKKPDNVWADLDAKNLIKIAAIGPAGWNIMAEELLSDQ